MAFESSTVSIGDATKKSHFDQLLDNTKYNKSNTIDVLTTEGDLLLRGTSIPERLAGGVLDAYLKGQGVGVKPIYEKLALKDTGIKMGFLTRATAGDQAITGVGFESSVVLFFAIDDVAVERNESYGFDDGTSHYCIYISEDGLKSAYDSSVSIYIKRDASNLITASVSTIESDGFTLTWSLTGVDRANVVYLCLP